MCGPVCIEGRVCVLPMGVVCHGVVWCVQGLLHVRVCCVCVVYVACGVAMCVGVRAVRKCRLRASTTRAKHDVIARVHSPFFSAPLHSGFVHPPTILRHDGVMHEWYLLD